VREHRLRPEPRRRDEPVDEQHVLLRRRCDRGMECVG
jgi:hypothetical protein